MASIGFDTNGNLKINGSARAFGSHTAYNLISGSLALAGSTIKSGFATTLYTGNGTTQSVVTGVDMATQWGDDPSETYGGLVWLKSRGITNWHHLHDTIRGETKSVQSSTTNAEGVYSTLTNFLSNGFSVGTDAGVNTNNDNMVSWNFQTTHRTSGVTNHGKPYTCHYNPYTGFTIVKYEGSGIAGHEIPHHLGRKLGFSTQKKLTAIGTWRVFADTITTASTSLRLDGTDALFTDSTLGYSSNDSSLVLSTHTHYNASANQYILYGWANSYFDESNTLIGNYEVGVYQGTGAAGNKVTTRGKPAWVMVKRLDSTGNWHVCDVTRSNFGARIVANQSIAESTTVERFAVGNNYFEPLYNGAEDNAAGGQYLYMVVYDNDSGSGKSKYPKATDTTNLNINATIPFANGIDANGAKNTILVKNETVSGLTFTQGKNYVYSKNDGTYGISYVAPTYSNVNPANGGDFYNITENKWYTSAGVAITESRNYLNAIVYADQNGQPTYVEQLPKTHYFDEVKANEYQGKNACTAWVNFDGTTTPPTIRDSYNVKSVIRTGTGTYDVYFENPMDNSKYSISVNFLLTLTAVTETGAGSIRCGEKSVNKIRIASAAYNDSVFTNALDATVQIFGGKNV